MEGHLGGKMSSFSQREPRLRAMSCLHCRRRKIKCDSNRPACSSCVRDGKSNECLYDDSDASETFELYRMLEQLEKRWRDLNASRSAAAQESPQATQECIHDAIRIPENGGTGVLPTTGNETGALSDEPPIALSKYLVDAFMPHAEQCGLSVPTDNFKARINGSPPDPNLHPALKNSVWLWGCHFARDPRTEPHKATFLRRSLENLHDLLFQTDKVLQAIQTECLLSSYFLAHGRRLEGIHHINSAALLTVIAGFHQLVVPSITGHSHHGSNEILAFNEKLHAFWNTFVLERCWNALNGFPSQQWSSQDPRTVILSPWPSDSVTPHLLPPVITPQPSRAQHTRRSATTGAIGGQAAPIAPVENFLASNNGSRAYAMAELRAKCGALMEHAVSIEGGRDHRAPMPDVYQRQFSKCQSIITGFCGSLPPLPQGGNRESSFAMGTVFTTHAMAHAAMMRLHCCLAQQVISSHGKCLDEAREIAGALRLLNKEDFNFLEATIGACWAMAAAVFIRDLEITANVPRAPNRANVTVALDLTTSAMVTLGKIFPVVAQQAQTITAMRTRIL
ncbi:hypothetical protein BD410DRAFT_491282 [Rickenella mellea]|uniref:Zn(2)-C6 fungal-type domain-containing protein n=1 Tax=Rickenella mellea TaxID=50990 RepID=A0A4Y7PTE3_9AGAM|nr:hypothetical protein BD410DRAFT_491282 [Rickenella mellea]